MGNAHVLLSPAGFLKLVCDAMTNAELEETTRDLDTVESSGALLGYTERILPYKVRGPLRSSLSVCFDPCVSRGSPLGAS